MGKGKKKGSGEDRASRGNEDSRADETPRGKRIRQGGRAEGQRGGRLRPGVPTGGKGGETPERRRRRGSRGSSQGSPEGCEFSAPRAGRHASSGATCRNFIMRARAHTLVT